MDTANCQENGILLETIDHLKAALAINSKRSFSNGSFIGIFFIGVKLSNGQATALFYPYKMIPEAVCLPEFRQGHAELGENFEGQKSLSLLATMFREMSSNAPLA